MTEAIGSAGVRSPKSKRRERRRDLPPPTERVENLSPEMRQGQAVLPPQMGRFFYALFSQKMNTAKKFRKLVILAIFRTGKNWVLKTIILGIFRNFFDGPLSGAAGRISL
jgi:hypothetical protein